MTSVTVTLTQTFTREDDDPLLRLNALELAQQLGGPHVLGLVREGFGLDVEATEEK